MGVTLARELDRRKAGTLLRSAAIALLFVITYWPAFADLHAKYSEVDSYYSHGYLIPLVSLFLIWRKREGLKRMAVVPALAGLWVLGGGLLLYLSGRWWYVNVVSDFSMLVVLGGLTLSLFGGAMARELLFPVAYLVFMIPLPKITIIYITFWLKLLAASVASDIVSAAGVPLLLEGAFIVLPTGRLEVDNACSGLRSLIALTAVGVAYAYLLRVSMLKKCVVALAAIPIALAANVIRIVILIWISYLYGPMGRAFAIVDFTTGFLIFIITLTGLYIVSKGVMVWEARGMSHSLVGSGGRTVAP